MKNRQENLIKDYPPYLDYPKHSVRTETKMKPFHLVIREKRKNYGITQVVLADYLGVSPSTYCNYESGDYRINGDILIELIALFNIHISEISNLTNNSDVIKELQKESEQRRTAKRRVNNA